MAVQTKMFDEEKAPAPKVEPIQKVEIVKKEVVFGQKNLIV